MTNEAGSDKFTYQVIGYSPPIFENITLNQTTVNAIVEKPFELRCQVNGYPIPKV